MLFKVIKPLKLKWHVDKENEDLCPIPLPRQNYFGPGQDFNLSQKSIFLIVKWMENNFLAMEKKISSA